jgi:GNAT superfamily N-acetyltransferase
VHLRRATPSDAAAIRDLVLQAYGKYVERIGRRPKPMTADYTAADAEHQVWVAEFGDEVGAVLELIPHSDHLLIENIAVEPRRQGAGIGRALLDFAEAEAFRQHCNEVRLYTNALFTENLAIYRKRGYGDTHRNNSGPVWPSTCASGFSRHPHTTAGPGSCTAGQERRQLSTHSDHEPGDHFSVGLAASTHPVQFTREDAPAMRRAGGGCPMPDCPRLSRYYFRPPKRASASSSASLTLLSA